MITFIIIFSIWHVNHISYCCMSCILGWTPFITFIYWINLESWISAFQYCLSYLYTVQLPFLGWAINRKLVHYTVLFSIQLLVHRLLFVWFCLTDKQPWICVGACICTDRCSRETGERDYSRGATSIRYTQGTAGYTTRTLLRQSSDVSTKVHL